MKSNIHRLGVPQQISAEDVAKTRKDVENKLNAKRLNISKTTDDDVEVLSEFVKMTLNEVVVSPALELFSKKASKEALTKGREAAAAICPLCQEMYGKKNKLTQCQFCAKSCCTQCCFKSRLDPEAKNAENADKCLICTDCEDKYLNVLHNQKFRKSYAGLNKLMEELQAELVSIEAQKVQQKERLQSAKPKEDPQIALNRTMKIAKFKKQVQTAQKDIEKIEKDSQTQSSRTGKLEQAIIQKQKQADETRKQRERRILEAEKKRQEDQEQQKRRDLHQLQMKAQKEAEEEARRKKHLVVEAQKAKRTAEQPIPVEPQENPTDEFEVIPPETVPTAIPVSNSKDTPVTLQEDPKQEDDRGVEQESPVLLGSAPQQVVVQVLPSPQPKRPDSIEEDTKSKKSYGEADKVSSRKSHQVDKASIVKSSEPFEADKADKTSNKKSKQPSEADNTSNQPKARKSSADGPAAASVQHDVKSEKHKANGPSTANKPEIEEEVNRASRTHSEYGLKNEDKPRPTSSIYDADIDSKSKEDDQMMSRSMIVESEPKEEAVKRKPSKNMTEKQILTLRVPPTKNERLYRQSTDKAPRLNASVKETSTSSLLEGRPTPLSKEQILRKSRNNEQLEESQTPHVDQKSKCSCAMF